MVKSEFSKNKYTFQRYIIYFFVYFVKFQRNENTSIANLYERKV